MTDSVLFRIVLCLFCGLAMMCIVAAIEWGTR
jgi:hypothetical protein